MNEEAPEARQNGEGMPEDEDSFRGDDDIGSRYHNDTFDVEQPSDSEEGKEWEEEGGGEKESYTQDWEKEAKIKVNIEMDDPSIRRRKTIYDLESYASYASPGSSMGDILRQSIIEVAAEPPTKIRYSVSMGMSGIARIDLSPLTQKIVGCVIGDNVTTEYPWVYVRKEIIEDNIDLHSESSDFLPVRDEIHTFPGDKIFIGYAPSLTEKAQFYICLTEESRDVIVRQIHEQREEHENRVRNAVYKPVGQWEDLGSASEVDAGVVKSTRPLYEIELTCTTDSLGMQINLTDRGADDQRDGYIELLSYRQIFDNVRRKLVSRPTQAAPNVRHNEAQTAPSISANSWFQYLYEYGTVDLSTYTEEKIDSLKDFLRRYTDEICDQVLMNSTWDIYTNDYANLVRSEKDTQAPVPIGYNEHQSYYEAKLTVNKIINDLCWHPFWTGMAMIAYTRHAKSEYLTDPFKKLQEEVLITHEGDNRVLVWSFNDFLAPKLILECPREVTSITVCPLDGNVVVGGCANGQVVIWHIPGRIEQAETVVTRTSAQVKYMVAMRSLMTWMRETGATSVIRPTAMSSLKHSQKEGITRMRWLPSHYTIDRNGRIASLPKDTPFSDLSRQFVTGSEDGTIAFWDIK